MALTERKYKLIERLTRNDETLVIYRRGESGGGFMRQGDGLLESADFIMGRSDKVKDFILAAASQYLRKYEMQKQDFIKQLLNNEK